MNLRPWFTSANLLLATFAAKAAGAETNGLPALSSSPDSLLEVVLRMLGALILIFALFLAAVWFFKRSRFFTMYQSTPAQIKILETRSLGYRNSLLVVGYSERRFLLAVSPAGVSVVSALPDAENGTSTEPLGPAGRNDSEFAKRLSNFETGKGS